MLDIMRDFSSIMANAQTAVRNLGTSILAVRDNIPLIAAQIRQDLAAAASAVTSSATTLDDAKSVVDNFVGSLDADMDRVKDLISQYFLQYATAYAGLVLSGVLVLGITLLPVGLCVPVYKCGIFSNLALLVLVWLAAAVTMPMGALMSDICIDPGPAQSIVNLVDGTADRSTVDTLEYYLLCKDTRDPSDPSFNPPGAYGDIVTFSRQSDQALADVFQARQEIEDSPLVDANSEPLKSSLDDMSASAYAVGNITRQLVALGSCTSIGGRTYRPVVKALCEEVVGNGIAQFWATHIAMGTFLMLLMASGVWFCHGVRHPGGEKNRLAAAKQLRAEQLRQAAAMGYSGSGQMINPVGQDSGKHVEMPPMHSTPPYVHGQAPPASAPYVGAYQPPPANYEAGPPGKQV